MKDGSKIPAAVLKYKLELWKKGIFPARYFINTVIAALCPKDVIKSNSRRQQEDISTSIVCSQDITLQLEPTNDNMDSPHEGSSVLELPVQVDLKRGGPKLRTDLKLTSSSNIYNGMNNQAQLRKSQPLVGEEALSPPAFPQASSNMGDAPLGGPLSRCQYETNYEMDLDMRSHWVVSTDLSTPTNSKSLADELREADYPLAPQPSTSASNGTLMELEESTPPPIAPAPTKLGLEPDCSRESSLTPSAQDGPEDPLLPLPHVNGNLDNSTEDTLLLSFGTLSAQEQLDIIERLELTKNRLLSLRRNNPHGPPCDQTGLRNSSDSDRGGIRPSSSAQDMLDSRPLPGPNNEILAATDAPEVAARSSGSPQVLRNGSVLVDWEQSLNQITELD
ncbi:UNVERIFIED_CONTAM: hypothetical protein K2H54_058994 [Gekko kuhli]